MFGFIRNFFGPKTDFKALMQRGAIIVDVRTPDEYKSGHIDSSLNIPVQIIQGKIAELKRKGKPIIAVCRSGARSSMATSILKGAGIDAYNGGAWNSLAAALR